MKKKTTLTQQEILEKSPSELKTLTFDQSHALIFDYQRFTINDGPGIRTMVYFKGCPLRCPWCHNPESLEYHIEVANDKSEIYGFYATPQEIANYCLKDIDYYRNSGGGVTFTGGEAIMQVDHLVAIAKILKKSNIHLTLETSGFAPINEYRKILPYLDLLLIDHKAVPEEYSWKIKGDYNNMIHLHQEANKRQIEVWVRMPIIPGQNDSKARFDDAISLTKMFNNISAVEILPYHVLGISKALKVNKPQMAKRFLEPDQKMVQEWINYFHDHGCKIARQG